MPKFKFQNHEVYYDVLGEGKSILLLNGIMMSTKSWEPFAKTLAENNKLIRVDFIDQGQTDKYTGTKKYTQDLQVELVKELLNTLNLDKVNVVGISYGGEVAIQFATKYKESVDRLVLLNTTAYTSPWLADIGKSWNEIGKTRNGKNYYLATIPVIYSPEFYQERLDWMKNREKLLTPLFSDEVFLDSMERLTDSAENYDASDVLNQITARTLIVASNEDYLTPVNNQHFLHKNIKNSELVIIPNAGHASMYEKPALFVTLVLGFINASTLDYIV